MTPDKIVVLSTHRANKFERLEQSLMVALLLVGAVQIVAVAAASQNLTCKDMAIAGLIDAPRTFPLVEGSPSTESRPAQPSRAQRSD